MRKCLLAAFALLLLASPSLGDSLDLFFVSGGTNTQFCALVSIQCPEISYAMYLVAEPLVGVPSIGTTYAVLSLLGVVNGQDLIVGDGPGRLSSEFGVPGVSKPAPDVVPYILDGFHGFFGWDDVGPMPTAFMAWDDGQNSPPADLQSVVTWNIWSITPEPSSLALLGVGSLALLGLAVKRRRSNSLSVGGFCTVNSGK